VLGAGNIASIAPLDVLYKLVAEGQVCMLKMNPVNEYLGPFLEERFRSLIKEGFVRVVYGGGDVGAWLCEHPLVEEIHVTGSARTYNAIVFGGGPEGAERKAKDQPKEPTARDQRARQREPDHRRAGPVDGGGPAVPGRADRDAEDAQRRLQLHRRAGAGAIRRVGADAGAGGGAQVDAACAA
jgi:hypothetical protein